MPTYYTPPQTPISSPPPSLPPLSRSNSYSQSTSTSSRSSRSSKPSKHGSSTTTKGEEHSHKAPYIFLGSIAAASLLAHKYWPKGFPHGDKEDWELSKLALRAKQRRQAEKAARRAGGSSSGRDSHDFLPSATYADDERELRYADYHKRGGRGRSHEGDYYLPHVDNVAYSDRDYYGHGWARREESSFSRGRDARQNRYDDLDSTSYRRATSITRSTSRERPWRSTPPAPAQRYLLEESTSISTGSRPRYLIESGTSSAAGRGWSQADYYDVDHPEGVIYVYRDLPTRSRRASFGAGEVGRYEGGHDRFWR